MILALVGIIAANSSIATSKFNRAAKNRVRFANRATSVVNVATDNANISYPNKPRNREHFPNKPVLSWSGLGRTPSAYPPTPYEALGKTRGFRAITTGTRGPHLQNPEDSFCIKSTILFGKSLEGSWSERAI